MGWFGYGLYDGDGTQTLHLYFLKWAKIEKDGFIYLYQNKTIIPKEKRNLLRKNYKLILNKIKYKHIKDEDSALIWQMLLSLYIDNNVIPPSKIIIQRGIEATLFLIKLADDFNSPYKRKKALKKFISRVENKFKILVKIIPEKIIIKRHNPKQ